MKHLENHSFITSAAAAAPAAAGATAGATAAITLEPCFSLLRENICVLQGGCNVRALAKLHHTARDAAADCAHRVTTSVKL
jgi:hypothetical protein